MALGHYSEYVSHCKTWADFISCRPLLAEVTHVGTKRGSVASPDQRLETSDPPDVKGFCEHIRTVQLGLLGICLLLLGVMLQERPRPLSRAISDVTTIASLASKSSELEAALQKYVDDTINPYLATNEHRLQMGKPAYVLGRWRDGTERSLRLSYPFSWKGNGPFSSTSKIEFDIRNPGQFQRFWNNCLSAGFVGVPAFNDDRTQITFTDEDTLGLGNAGKLLVIAPDLESFKTKVRAAVSPDEIKSNQLFNPIDLDLGSHFVDSLESGSWSVVADLSSKIAGGHKSVHVFADKLDFRPLTLLSIFLQASNMQGKWKDAPFTEAFGELTTVMENVSTLTFKDALDYLQRQAIIKTPVDTVDVFGAKLPTGQITAWGIIIILGFQLYLLVLLSQLFKVFCAYKPYVLSWSGLFPNQLARGFTIVSCALLPLAILVCLEVQKWPESAKIWAIYSVSLLVSLFLCLGVLSKLRQIWRAVEEI